MRLFLVGQKAFGAAVFELAREAGHVVAAVSAPAGDRLAAAAAASGVPVLPDAAPASVPDGVDLIVTAHGHAFIGAAARARARLGAIGYHPSLLPIHRGRDAVRWAVHMRERVTGGSVYWLTDAVDGGPIAAQEHAFIRPDDTPESLWRRELFPLGLRLLSRALADLERGVVVAVPQDDALATWEPSWDRAPLRLHATGAPAGH